MRIKRSGRVVMTASVTLLLFASLVMWHNKPSHSNNIVTRQHLVEQLSQADPALWSFISQLDSDPATPAFFSIGLRGKQAWPYDMGRACYSDPLAAQWQFTAIRESFPGGIEVIRYRSLDDFLELLLISESKTPGFITGLNLRSHTPISENPLAVSMGSVVAGLVGLLGLFVVKYAQKKR